MKLDKDDIQEILEMIDQVEAFRPIVKDVFGKIKSFGPEIKDFIDGISDYVVDRNAANFRRYLGHDFSREEALLLVMDQWFAVKRSIRNVNTKNGRGQK